MPGNGLAGMRATVQVPVAQTVLRPGLL